MSDGGINWAQIEHLLNRLEHDEGIYAKRTRAVSWVCARLERAMLENAPARFGLTSEQWGQFMAGESSVFEAAAEQILPHLCLSRARRREYDALAAVDRAEAAAWLCKRLLDAELDAFLRRSGITYPSWRRFLLAKTYVSDKTAESIVSALELTSEEEAELRPLFLRGTFDDVEALKDPVRAGIAAMELTIAKFLELSYISADAWEAFQSGARGKVTSQGTLLKLVIGLKLSPEEAWGFLGFVHSGFFMERDLVVLTCMHSEIYDIERLSEVLEKYSWDSVINRRLFPNLYPPP